VRASMYVQDRQRQVTQNEHVSLATFISELEMAAHVGTMDNHTRDRIHQLIQKTNQINLTTRRHSLATLQRWADAEDSEVAWLRLQDRFGDLGLVCVGIIRQIGSELWEIDSFVMSCRVMGRGVEDAFLSYLTDLARSKGARKMRASYIRTLRNEPAGSFYSDHEFTEIEHPDESTWVYQALVTEESALWPETIKQVKNTGVST